MHQNTLRLPDTALVIIDMQEAFRDKIADFTAISKRISVLVQAAKLLSIPTLVTEQYPKGLGPTAEEIKQVLSGDVEIVEKTTFSSCGVQPFLTQLEQTRADQILVCGIEAHVCVNQTVHDLLASEYQVHVLAECISSRDVENKRIALAKMQMSGAIPSSLEMALFELMRDAKHEQFRAIQQMIVKS
jgi:nicotinamidase-related amidase